MSIWYVAYGSNLLRSRFEVYLQGGRVAGSSFDHPGARDRSGPLDDRPVKLDHPLRFAHQVVRWGGGGVCFLDSQPVAGAQTLARAWQITEGQLADVWVQENGVDLPPPEVDVEQLRLRGHLDWEGGRRYQRLLYLGEADGIPQVTITAAEPPSPTPGGSAYLAVVASGLMESWGLDAAAAAGYLARQVGNQDLLSVEEIVGFMSGSVSGGG